jgi:hypothetical protein
MNEGLGRRLLYGLIAGMVGAFIAWLVTETLFSTALERAHGSGLFLIGALYGLLVGLILGISLGIAEGMMHRTVLRLGTNVLLGAWLGALGGCIGESVAEMLYALLRLLNLGVLAKMIGWGCFGAFIGSAQGLARQSKRGTINSLIGGAVGGSLGGLAFEVFDWMLLGVSQSSSFQRGIGLLLTGAFIGMFAPMFERLLAYGTLKVVSGKMEGKEFILDKPMLTVGRDEHCDIPIYYDKSIMPRHALLEWSGKTYRVVALGNAWLTHKGRVVKTVELSHNDIITVGNTKLFYKLGAIGRETVFSVHNLCSSCGTQNRRGAKFCRQCGATLTTAMAGHRARVWISSLLTTFTVFLLLLSLIYLISRSAFSQASHSHGLAKKAKIAVTPKGYDDIGQVLRELGRGYEYEQIKFGALSDLDSLQRYQITFINCADELPMLQDRREVTTAIRCYVERGGVVYASDWAGFVIQNAFPEYLRLASDRGRVQIVEATVVDQALASVVGSKLSLRFNAEQWVAIDAVSRGVTVHLIGDYVGMSGEVHRAKPLLISFRHGNGYVIFTSFHNEPQLSETERKLLQFLVIRPVTFDLTKQADSLLLSRRSSPAQEFVGTVSSGMSSPPYALSLNEDGRLFVVLSWHGGDGEFEIQLRTEQGELVEKLHGRKSPLSVETKRLRAGMYYLHLFAQRAPVENTPFVIRVGVRR